MSEYEQREVLHLLDEIYAQYGKGLEYDEFVGEGWLTYLEARKRISVYSNQFWQMVANTIVEKIDEMRRERNRRISLESRLSLNQTIGDSREEIRSILFPTQGDFTNGVVLWMDARNLGEEKYKVMQDMSHGESDDYIIKKFKMSDTHYFTLKDELKSDMIEYIERR